MGKDTLVLYNFYGKVGEVTREEAVEVIRFVKEICNADVMDETGLATDLAYICSEVESSSKEAKDICTVIAGLLRGNPSFFLVMTYYYLAIRAPFMGVKPLAVSYEKNGGNVALVINEAEYEVEIILLSEAEVVKTVNVLFSQHPVDHFKTREEAGRYVGLVHMQVHNLRPYTAKNVSFIISSYRLTAPVNLYIANAYLNYLNCHANKGLIGVVSELIGVKAKLCIQEIGATPERIFKFNMFMVLYSPPVIVAYMLDLMLGKPTEKDEPSNKNPSKQKKPKQKPTPKEGPSNEELHKEELHSELLAKMGSLDLTSSIKEQQTSMAASDTISDTGPTEYQTTKRDCVGEDVESPLVDSANEESHNESHSELLREMELLGLTASIKEKQTSMVVKATISDMGPTAYHRSQREYCSDDEKEG